MLATTPMEDLKLHPSRLQEPCGDTTPESNAAIIDEASLDQGDVHANTKILGRSNIQASLAMCDDILT